MTAPEAERVARMGRRGIALVMIGLGVQLAATVHWSPATFIVSATAGVGLVLAGAATFGWAVLRARRSANAERGPQA